MIRDVHASILLLLLFITTSILLYSNSIWRPSEYNKPNGANNGDNNNTLSSSTSVDRIKNLSKSIFNSFDGCSNYYSFRSAIQSITRKECFARLDYIERLSVREVSVLFRYASHSYHTNPKKKKSVDEQNQNLRAVIGALDIAVKISRGHLSEEGQAAAAITNTCTEEEENNNVVGDIDALRFVAVTRIFAEWRNLRLIPKEGGYQRYALGLSLAYRDILQNLEKIEGGVHEYLRYHHQHQQTSKARTSFTSMTVVPSPTLRQLLRFEVETGVHKKLPYLKEQSSASGLLWTTRQLQYQLATFSNSLEVPEYYPSSKDAAKAAYRKVYDDYHGWAVKQIFSQSFNASPTLDKIWLSINPPNINNNNGQQQSASTTNSTNCFGIRRDDDDYPLPPSRKLSDFTTSSAATTSSSSSSNSQISSSFSSDSGESIIPIDARHNGGSNKFLLTMEKVGAEIAEKWEDLLRMFNCGGKEEKEKKHKVNLILSSKSHFSLDQLLDNNADFVRSPFHNNNNDNNISNHGSNSIIIDDNSSIVSACSSSTESLPHTGMEAVNTTDASSNHRHIINSISNNNNNNNNNPIESSKRDVEGFVKYVLPMVTDLGQLINEFNMNDPTKA